MMFGWLNRRERRDFTVTTTDRAVAVAFGNTATADVAGTAAATAAAGILGRSFAAASVMPTCRENRVDPCCSCRDRQRLYHVRRISLVD